MMTKKIGGACAAVLCWSAAFAVDPEGVPTWFDAVGDKSIQSPAPLMPVVPVPESPTVDAKERGEIAIGANDVIALMGDSITEEGGGWWGGRPSYPTYVKEALKLLGVVPKGFYVRGAGGHRLEHMYARLEKDVFAVKATKMTLFGGTNHAWRDGNGELYVTFTNNYLKTLDACAAKNVEVIPFTITQIRGVPKDRIKKYNDFIRATAKARGLKCIDLENVIDAETKDKHTFDGTHPNFDGRKAIAWAILKALGVREERHGIIKQLWDSMTPRRPKTQEELTAHLPDGRRVYPLDALKATTMPQLNQGITLVVVPESSYGRNLARGGWAVRISTGGDSLRAVDVKDGKIIAIVDRVREPKTATQWTIDPKVYDAKLMARAKAGLDGVDDLGSPLWIDLSKTDYSRHAYDKLPTNRVSVVSAGGTKYQSHPTTALLDDDKTMFCVWDDGHAGKAGAAAKSMDAGRTWTRIDDKMPANYSKYHDAPVIYRLTGPDGKSRLWVFCGWTGDREKDESAMPRIMSDDNGATWREMPRLGAKFRCVISFNSIVRLKDGSYLGIYHRSPKACLDGRPLELLSSVTKDGGFTWSDPVVIARDERYALCEPCVFRGDNDELCCLIRENNRTGRSKMIFSKDEGRTWSGLQDAPLALLGDRHAATRLADGRIFVAFRDVNNSSPTYAYPVGWIGPYSSIKDGTGKGGYKIKLEGNIHKSMYDCGYQSVHQRKNGEIIVTTYTVTEHVRGPKPSIVSVRFTPEEADHMIAARVASLKDDANALKELKMNKTITYPDHIVAPLSDMEKYEYIHPRLRLAFDFLREHDLKGLAAGDYVIEEGMGGGTRASVRAMVQEMKLKPYEGETQHVEAHKAFVDIQVPVTGPETFGLATLDPENMPKSWKYNSRGNMWDAAVDIGFADVPCRKVTVKPGEFALFMPVAGGHAPCFSDDGAREIKKIVIKVRMN